MFKASMVELANSIYVVALIGTFLGFKQVVLTTFGVQEVGTFSLASVKCLDLAAWGSAICVFKRLHFVHRLQFSALQDL